MRVLDLNLTAVVLAQPFNHLPINMLLYFFI